MQCPTGRALVLGSGGVTGIAFAVGVLAAWDAEGLDLAGADLVVGTSAGALVGAYLASGVGPAELSESHLGRVVARGSLGPAGLALLVGAQLWPDREQALRGLGRATASSSRLTEEFWVDAIGGDLARVPWPASLTVVVTDMTTGRPRALTAADGVPLDRAVAASCAVPAVYPQVHLGSVPHADGGLRSPANVDLARSCGRVLALTPQRGARDPRRRPGVQLAGLPASTAWLHVWPDAATRRAMGLDPLSDARNAGAHAAGLRQGRATAEAAASVWGAPPASR